jgi:hypothetical protein
MTEPRNPWDDAQNAVADALTEALALFGTIPDTQPHTEARNRIVMAMTSLDSARDFLAAARNRMPKE